MTKTQALRVSKKRLTNEETKVPIYRNGGKPSDPATVTRTTPLSKLNLNWSEGELPERTRTKHVHRLHPYLGKFIPQLVEIFLRKYFDENDVVLDPFCGSGTTLVQASELGIPSIGYDISAFNILLCEAKLTNYDVGRARKEAFSVLEGSRSGNGDSKQINLWPTAAKGLILQPGDNSYLKTWFAPQALRELLLYRANLEERNFRYKNLMKVILSRSARSARLTTHFDLDFPKKPQTKPYHCYKHSRECAPTTSAMKFLERYTLDSIERIEEFSLIRTQVPSKAVHGDSKNAKLPRISGVITSPPYLGLIDYHEQHAYAYHLLGLKDKREKEIGAAVKGSGRKAKAEYIEGITAVFENALSSMKTNGRMIIVANDKHEIYPSIAEKLGVKVEGVVQRHVNRRTGRRSSDFFESIFIWRKP